MKEYFPNIKKVEFAEDRKKRGLYFRQYNKSEIVGGKPMNKGSVAKIC